MEQVEISCTHLDFIQRASALVKISHTHLDFIQIASALVKISHIHLDFIQIANTSCRVRVTVFMILLLLSMERHWSTLIVAISPDVMSGLL